MVQGYHEREHVSSEPTKSNSIGMTCATPGYTPETYRDYVKALCMRNPSLLTLYEYLSRAETKQYSGRFAALDFREDVIHPVVRIIEDVDSLGCELHDKAETKPHDDESLLGHPLQGRLLIIEDLTIKVMELLGTTLDIDPLFFAMHLHTLHRTGRRNPTPDEATLPSRFQGKDYMNISYHRPVTRDRNGITGDKFVRATAIDRKLVFLHSEPVGLAQHRASVMKLRMKGGAWLGEVPWRKYTFSLLLLTRL
jgi:hypothetical protein